MNRYTQRPRRGLSKIELLGCLLAMGGGVWIGAQYTGLNLESVAYKALDDTEMLEKVPEEWRPANPDCPDGDCGSPEEIRLQEAGELRSELELLQKEATRLGVKPKLPEPVSLSAEDETARERTLAYWNELRRIVSEVTKLQNEVAPYVGTEDHGHAVAVRRRALDYGEKSIVLLDSEGVDPEAITTGVRVAEWFAYGSETLKAALELRGRQAVEGRAASAAEVWSRTEGELRMRTELVSRMSSETATYLRSRYFTEFGVLDF